MKAIMVAALLAMAAGQAMAQAYPVDLPPDASTSEALYVKDLYNDKARATISTILEM